MEMIDLGRKEEMPTAVESKGKSRVHYPSFSISNDKISQEIKDLNVGESCRCEIVVRKTGDSIDTYGEGNSRIEFEIRKIGYVGKAGKITQAEYLAKSDEDRKKYDDEQADKSEDSEDDGKDDSEDKE